MIIERTIQGYRCSDIVGDDWITKHYIGYTKIEAIRMFRHYLKTFKP